MWLWATTPADEVGDDYGFKDFGDKFKAGVKNAFNSQQYQTFFVKLNDEAVKFSRTLAGGLDPKYAQSFERSMYDAMLNGQKMGLTMSDANDYVEDFAQETGKIPQIQSEVIQNTKALSLLTGISVKELAKYTAEYQKIGMGQEQAQRNLFKIYATARAYGVNASKLTKDVQSQIEKAATVQFKGGVEGLTKMAARAQQLGLDFKEIMKAGEKALDPEKAIEMAAGMQMLGGNVGALGDPFKLLYMAQNDLGALQDEFIKVTAASADYNEETGEFKIGTQQMYRMREMADQLNISYEEIQRSAIAAAKESKILSETTFQMPLDEDEKKLIASMAEKKDGVWKIQMPGTKDWVDISTMNSSQIGELQKANELMNQTDGQKLSTISDTLTLSKSIAEAQLSAAEKQANALRSLSMAAIFDPKAGQQEINNGKMVQSILDRTAIIDKATQMFSNEAARFVTAMTSIITQSEDNLKAYVTNPAATPSLKKDIEDILANIAALQNSISSPSSTDIEFEDALFTKGKIEKSKFGQLLPSKMSFAEGDEFLAAPNIEDFINKAGNAFSILTNMENINTTKLGTLQDILSENINLEQSTNITNLSANPTDQNKNNILDNLQSLLTKNSKLEQLSSVVNVNTNSTNEVKGDVGVNGEVKLKIEGLNGSLANILESDTNFQRMFKENVMNIVNERLSKSYSEKLGNL